MGSLLRILVVGGDPYATAAIVGALEQDADFVLHSFSDPAAALRLVADDPPDVVVIDAQAREDGLDVVTDVRALTDRAHILVLTGPQDDDGALASDALRRGADGILPKDVRPDELPAAARSLARGEAVLPGRLAMRLVEQLREPPHAGAGLRPVRSELSAREWEVLDLVAAGETTREIAEELGLSPETVRSHVKRILRKLGAHSRAEATERARTMLADSAGQQPPGRPPLRLVEH